jgi:hypothetical protein
MKSNQNIQKYLKNAKIKYLSVAQTSFLMSASTQRELFLKLLCSLFVSIT